MKRLLLSLLASMALTARADAQSHIYAEGQVWAYKTRPGDSGSLLKIQRIERDRNGDPVFHISVIGFHLKARGVLPILPHEPVSKRSLDVSVTEERPDPGTFPSADDGIAVWRSNHGGVYTISIAETLDVLDRTVMDQSSN